MKKVYPNRMVVCIDGNKRIAYLEKIKDDGNVVVIKFDGERLDTQYTVFISFPVGLNRPMIRVDKSSLIEALRDVVKEYLSV